MNSSFKFFAFWVCGSTAPRRLPVVPSPAARVKHLALPLPPKRTLLPAPRGTPRKKGALKSRAPASDLRQAFAAFNQDQDGALSHSELVAALSLPGPQAFSSPEEAARAADKIMADFDANGDGKLQFEEVTRTCAGPHVRCHT